MMYLLAVLVVVGVLCPERAFAQCTTKYCEDDDHESDLSSTVSRLRQELMDQQVMILALQQQQANVEEIPRLQQELTEQKAMILALQAKFEEIGKCAENCHKCSTKVSAKCDVDGCDTGYRYNADDDTCVVVNQPEDCADLLRRGNKQSGVYDVFMRKTGRKLQVYCDMDTDNGGWLVVQRRQDGSVDFYRDWKSYKEGFGDVAGEFWLGNDNLHDITSTKRYELRFDIGDFHGVRKYATYAYLTVAGEWDNYRIAFGTYTGTAGNSMRIHAGMQFSTKDRDNDVAVGYSCAVRHTGAWWYSSCLDANINGLYNRNNPYIHTQGVMWQRWNPSYSFKYVDMKLRPSS